MRVMFDQRIFLRQKFGGVSRYFVELIKCLPQFGVDPSIFALLHMSGMLDEVVTRGLVGKRIGDQRLLVTLARRLGVAATPLYALATGQRIVHETYFGPTRVAPPGCKTVITVHDMINELFPEQFANDSGPAWKAASIARAGAIVCVSENTRRDVIALYPETADRAVTIHLGIDPARFRKQGVVSVEQPYILYVGPRYYAYKNFRSFIEAFAGSPDLRNWYRVLCVGPQFSSSEREHLSTIGIEDRVRAVQPCDDELAQLYAGAAVFVYPSRYEGFGIPPLEAMAAGCPVIALREASMPEVCGDAAYYCSDPGPDGIAEAMQKVLGDTLLAADLRSRGGKRIAHFTWRECARRHAEVYARLVANG